MKAIYRKYQQFFILLGFAVVVLSATTMAWAALSLVETSGTPEEAAAFVTDSGNGSHATPIRKSRAPEPSTLALFGSGLIGMIISFFRKMYHVAKRVLDIFLAVIAIILLWPLYLLTALLIKGTSKGPLLFTQTRVGQGGRLFKIYKFRTMHVDAEKETGPVWAQKDDPRLIPAGEFIRKTHLDEIPQFINVLKGDMSVIGPRPERPEFVGKLKEQITDYEKRLAVKPGITGLAQVWHNYDETIKDVRKKIKYDLLYIKKICFLTDIRILLRTFRVVFTGEGAR